MGDSFGDFMIGEATRKTQEINQLGAKLAAARRLVSKWREEAIGWPADSTRAALGRCADELEAAISPTTAQPAAGEEIDCVRCGNKHSGGC